MSTFATREDVIAKIEWEGGMADVLEYGLKPTDMPEGDDELRTAWSEMYWAFDQFQMARANVESILGINEL